MGNSQTKTNLESFYDELDIPILDIGDRQGDTDYIDFLTLNEVTEPVMKGTDKFSRKFIVVKFMINEEKLMQTFFQRYTNGSLWMACGHATRNLIDTQGGIKEEQEEFIRGLITTGSAQVLEEHYPTFNLDINKKAVLDNSDKTEKITL
jgi:hypothetical protein